MVAFHTCQQIPRERVGPLLLLGRGCGELFVVVVVIFTISLKQQHVGRWEGDGFGLSSGFVPAAPSRIALLPPADAYS